MNCPSCGAPLHLTENDDSWRCLYCRRTYAPEAGDDGVRVLGEASPLKCPVCAQPLEHAALAGTRMLYCTHCRGILIGMNEFAGLIDALHAGRRGGVIQPPVDRTELQRHLDCPQCQRRMDTHIYEGPGNIVIDDCSRCYLDWLDKGELMKVVRAPDH